NMKGKTDNDTVLVTGGSGMVGRRLTLLLNNRGYSVRVLSRKKVLIPGANVFTWDYGSHFIEPGALTGVSHIIHLAGESIGNGRWTASRKREIVDSRVLSANLLFEKVRDEGLKLKSFISSSATGYYGAVTSDIIFEETDLPGRDFAASTCVSWEDSASRFSTLSKRVVVIRTGIVLSENGGMLGQLLPVVRSGVSPLPGSGKQWIPWIHIDDLCAIYARAISCNPINGTYNGVSPAPVTYKALINAAAKTLGKKIFTFATPELRKDGLRRKIPGYPPWKQGLLPGKPNRPLIFAYLAFQWHLRTCSGKE
ncbi:MAG: TIGR01777 family oxidoreductase, partial [Bacteroidales bacterium]